MIRRTGMVVLGMAAIAGILAWPAAWIVDRNTDTAAVVTQLPADGGPALAASAEPSEPLPAKPHFVIAERTVFIALVGAVVGFLLIRYGSAKKT